jgi:alpha-tubulin suppressor-like RCC1 family protein
VKGLTFAVGADNNGQLGDGNNINRTQTVQPTYPLGNGGFVKFVTAGPDISWAITTSGSIFGLGSSQPPELTWGVGLLGDGNPSTIARSPMLTNVGSDNIERWIA